MLERIQRHCRNLIHAENLINDDGCGGEENLISSEVLSMGRNLELGGLCSLLETLQAMIIPGNKVDEMVASLRELKYRHLLIDATIENMEKRT